MKILLLLSLSACSQQVLIIKQKMPYSQAQIGYMLETLKEAEEEYNKAAENNSSDASKLREAYDKLYCDFSKQNINLSNCRHPLELFSLTEIIKKISCADADTGNLIEVYKKALSNKARIKEPVEGIGNKEVEVLSTLGYGFYVEKDKIYIKHISDNPYKISMSNSGACLDAVELDGINYLIEHGNKHSPDQNYEIDRDSSSAKVYKYKHQGKSDLNKRIIYTYNESERLIIISEIQKKRKNDTQDAEKRMVKRARTNHCSSVSRRTNA